MIIRKKQIQGELLILLILPFYFLPIFLTIGFRLYKHEPSGRGPLSSTWLTEIQQKCKSIEAAREMNMEQKEEMPQVMVSYFHIFLRRV